MRTKLIITVIAITVSVIFALLVRAQDDDPKIVEWVEYEPTGFIIEPNGALRSIGNTIKYRNQVEFDLGLYIFTRFDGQDNVIEQRPANLEEQIRWDNVFRNEEPITISKNTLDVYDDILLNRADTLELLARAEINPNLKIAFQSLSEVFIVLDALLQAQNPTLEFERPTATATNVRETSTPEPVPTVDVQPTVR